MKSPLFQGRIESLAFKINFILDFPDVSNNLLTIQAALEAVRKSENFKMMINLVLKIGNFLNYGTAKGNAQGFSLNALNQLDTFRGFDSQKTRLLDFMIQSISSTHKKVLNFITEFEPCQYSSKIDISDLELKLNEFEKGFNLVQRYHKQAETIRNDSSLKNFISKMTVFLDEALPRFEDFKLRVNETKKLLDSTIEYYGEAKGIKSAEFFQKFWNFAQSCKRSLESLSIAEGQKELGKIKASKVQESDEGIVQKPKTKQKSILINTRLSVKHKQKGLLNL